MKKKEIHVFIDEDLKQKFIIHCANEGVSQTDVVTDFVKKLTKNIKLKKEK